MGQKVDIGHLSEAVMRELEAYAELSAENMKAAVRKAGNTVRSDIRKDAPRAGGDYAKSWTAKVTAETASKLSVTVHSANRYRLAHLLEHGHALRNGGRARAFPHIAPAEEKGVAELEQELERSLRGG